ncbi:MAG: undecaprenyldiphospho-muramoylpentapeptide beta-N-acetylglucosaminyltransferase [Rikenellaceae bacterium]
MKEIKMRVIVSGGGTAGHIYPAVSVVKSLEKQLGKENCTALFVGAKGKIEERIVPKEGYELVALPVRGLIRSFSFQNIKTVIGVIKSFFTSLRVIKEFKPNAVIGFGGYASLPIMLAAKFYNINLYIWEGNSFAGLTNKLLNKYAKRAFVSFENMERFFDKDKIIISGNPIRDDFSSIEKKSEVALNHFGFSKEQKVLLIVGGSSGAKAINNAVLKNIDLLIERDDIGVIWQTGNHYYKEISDTLESKGKLNNIYVAPFIENMKLAYSVCDVITCRSGASTVTEVSRCKLAAIFVPSSGVTDDHQTKNAEVVVAGDAAIMFNDNEIADKLVPTALELLSSNQKREDMSQKIAKFAHSDAAHIIASQLIEDFKN